VRYVSRVPVHQDGSCNGLQHYAALGRDLTGGYAVNLCPSDKPQVRAQSCLLLPPGLVFQRQEFCLCTGPEPSAVTGLVYPTGSACPDADCTRLVLHVCPLQNFFSKQMNELSLQDVYTGVCALVRKRVEADAAAGVPEASALLRVTTGESRTAAG